MPEFLTVCEQAARAAGAVLLDWAGRFEVREKGPRDLVTQADIAAQECLSEQLLAEFPDHGFLGEESDSADESHANGKQRGYRWIVDPLDGTTNYVHGLPCYAVSVALEHDGQLVCGAIYDPAADECFTAQHGGGAFLNRKAIHVSGVRRMSDALVEMSFPHNSDGEGPEVRQFALAMQNSQGVRRSGSAALNLANMAAGRVDAYWSFNTHIWDIAAGALLVTEAGGCVSGPGGVPLEFASGHIVATASEPLHGEVLNMLQEGEAS